MWTRRGSELLVEEVGQWLREAEGGLCVVHGEAADEALTGLLGGIGVELDLAGQSVGDCVAGLAAAFGSGPAAIPSLSPTTPSGPRHGVDREGRVSALARTLADRDSGTLTVVLTGLHAARDPLGVAGTVARRLAAEPAVRVLVTTRPRTADGSDLVAALGPGTVLPVPPDDEDALLAPVRDRLREITERSPATARLWCAIGYGLGEGIPVEGAVWPAIAAALYGGPPATPADVAEALELAGPLVTVDTAGRARLRHRDLVLATAPLVPMPGTVPSGLGPEPAGPVAAGHRRIVSALRSLAAAQGWSDAPEYVRTWLPAHAAEGDAFADLLADEAALDQLDQSRLIEEVEAYYRGRPERPPAAAGLLGAGATLGEARPEQRRMLRVLGATQTGATAAPPDRPVPTQAEPAPAEPAPVWWPRWASHHTGASLVSLDGHRAHVTAMATVLMPDGRLLLASGCGDGIILLWDPVAAEQVGAALVGHEDQISALAALAAPDGRALLASGAKDGTVRLWDLSTGAELLRYAGSAQVAGLAAVSLRDGRTVLAVAGSTAIELWDPFGAAPAVTVATGVEGARVVAFADRGRTLLAARPYAPQVLVWDVDTRAPVRDFPVEPDPEARDIWHHLVAVPSPDGRTVLATTAVADGRVRLWDPVTGESLGGSATGHHDWRDGYAEASCLAALPGPDGGWHVVSVGSRDDTVRVWDPSTGADVAGVVVRGGGISYAMTAVPTPDGRTLLALGTGSRIWLWDPFLDRGRLPGHVHEVWHVVASTGAGAALRGPDGQPVLASTDLYSARLWDARTGQSLRRFVAPDVDTVQGVIPLADGRALVCDRHFDSRFWDPLTGEAVGTPLRAPFVRQVPRPDGTVWVAAATSYLNPGADPEPALRLWDPFTGEPTGTLRWPAGRIRASLSVPRPDGRVWLACRTDDDVVRFWDVDSAQPVGHPLPDEVRKLRLLGTIALPDGRSVLISGAEDGTLGFWDPATGVRVGPEPAGHRGAVRAAVVVGTAPARVWFAAGADDGAVRLWLLDAGSGDLRCDCVGLIPFGTPVRSVARLPDGALAVGTERGVAVLDLWPERAVQPLPAVPDTPVDTADEPGILAESVGGGGSSRDRDEGQPGVAQRQWQVAWRVETTPQVLLATGPVDGRELLFSAGDEAIQAWEPVDGSAVGDPYTAQTEISGLTTGVLDGRPVVISFGAEPGPEDGEYETLLMARVWDPVSHEPVGAPIDDEGAFTENDVAVGNLAVIDGAGADGPPLLVGVWGNEWGTGVATWDLVTRRQTGLDFGVDSVSEVYMDNVVPLIVDGQPAIVATFPDFDEDGDGDTSLICVWNVRTGKPIGRPWHVQTGRDMALTATVLSGRPVAAIADDDRIRLRRLPDGAPAGALPVADVGRPGLLRVGQLGDTPVLLAGHDRGVVTVWDLTSRQRLGTIDGLDGVKDLRITEQGLIVAATERGLTAIRLPADAG